MGDGFLLLRNRVGIAAGGCKVLYIIFSFFIQVMLKGLLNCVLYYNQRFILGLH